MKKLLGLSLIASTLAVSVPAIANAHDRYSYRVCRDEDGDRVPCGRRYYRTYEPAYRYRTYAPSYIYYRYREPSYYGYYGGGPGISLQFEGGRYGRW